MFHPQFTYNIYDFHIIHTAKLAVEYELKGDKDNYNMLSIVSDILF